jgi:outer membrane protein OmpA-like peptidoglycan-associated protein
MPESYKVLDEVVKILKENPELKLAIEGHTSGDGIFEANMKLSQSRANNVMKYFLSKGIEVSRITAKGFGPTHPINNGTTESAKSQNRRVEMKLSN